MRISWIRTDYKEKERRGSKHPGFFFATADVMNKKDLSEYKKYQNPI
jgi:hypothetical protein